MKTIAGAIVILAASIMLAAAVVGQENVIAAGRNADSMPGTAMVAAFIVGILGLILTAIGILDETGQRRAQRP
jgi:hypothetical protein